MDKLWHNHIIDCYVAVKVNETLDTQQEGWILALRSECLCPLRIPVLKSVSNVLDLRGGAFGRCLGCEGRTLMNQIDVPRREM